MSAEFDFKVVLMVKHPTRTFAEISAAVGREAKYGWTVGEPRKTPVGRALGGFRDESYCGFEIGSGNDGALASFLNRAMLKLKPVREALRELRATGGSLTLVVTWYPNGDTGENFSMPLLREMTDMGIELGINVYDDRGSE
jgi:hypothetical protein